MRVRVVAIAMLALVALTAGCAAGTVPGTPRPFRSPVPLTAPAGQVVFQVDGGSGMVPADYVGNRRPGLTVYGNGDAFVLARDNSFSSERPLALRKGRVTRGDLAGLVARAGRSGLFDGADFGEPGITDSPTTSVRFRPGSAAATTASAYALSWTEGDGTLSLRQRTNRQVLRALLDDLFDRVQRPVDWTPRRIEVSEAYATTTGRALDWPGPALAALLAARNELGRPCGIVEGATARRTYALARADGTGRWTDGPATRTLLIRALLPGEAGCRR